MFVKYTLHSVNLEALAHGICYTISFCEKQKKNRGTFEFINSCET